MACPYIGRQSLSGAESQNRTGDTAIFSRVLYQLSYLGERKDSSVRVGTSQDKRVGGHCSAASIGESWAGAQGDRRCSSRLPQTGNWKLETGS